MNRCGVHLQRAGGTGATFDEAMSMSTSTEVIAHHWAFAIFLIVAIGLCCLMLVGGWFKYRARARHKNVPV